MTRRANTKKREKRDCFAYKPRECVALKKKNCNGCTFYKTEAEVKAAREKALARINSLPNNQKTHIKSAYLKGVVDSDCNDVYQ